MMLLSPKFAKPKADKAEDDSPCAVAQTLEHPGEGLGTARDKADRGLETGEGHSYGKDDEPRARRGSALLSARGQRRRFRRLAMTPRLCTPMSVTKK